MQSVSVILFDALNTNFADQQYARANIIKFLESLHEGDRVGIYLLGRRLHILHDFTRDISGLKAAVKKFRGREEGVESAANFERSDSGDADLNSQRR